MDINKFTEKRARGNQCGPRPLHIGMGHQETDCKHLALALVQQEQGIVPADLEQYGHFAQGSWRGS